MAYGNTSYGGGSGSQAPTISATTTDVAGAAARSQRGAAAGVSNAPPNDDFVARLTMTGATGTLAYIVSNSTTETGEASQAVAGGTGTVWWKWTPGSDGQGTVDAGVGMVVDAFLEDGTNQIANLTPLQGSPQSAQSLTFDVRAGETYAIRAYSTTAGDTASHTLSWSVALAPLDVTLAPTTVPWAPGSVNAYVANDAPGSTVSFSFDGGAVLQTAVTDSEGGATFALSIPLLTVGDHTVHASSTSGRTLDITITVQNADSFNPPTPPTPPPVVSGAVGRWRFQDPVTGETWDFPVNPSATDSVTLPRTLTNHWTVAPDGQPIVFEGGRRARAWTAKGDLFYLADLNALRGWRRPYRIYVTDDFGRSFVIKIRRVATTPVRDVEYPEHHTYAVTALLFGAAP